MSETVQISSKKTIAVVTDDTMRSNYQQVELLNGIAQYVIEHNNYIIEQLTARDINVNAPFRNFDGIIVHSSLSDALVEKIKATGLPIVDLTGEYEDDKQIISVDSDAYKLGKMAAEWFLRRGFTNFAVFGFKDQRFDSHMNDGFTSTLRKCGYGCNILFRRPTPIPCEETESYNRKLQEWASELPRKTAVFCHGATLASQLVTLSLKCGRNVPKDIAIMSAGNDVHLCSLQSMTISGVDENMQGVGYAAMRVIAHILDHPVKPKKRRKFCVSPIGVVERESTRVYPVDPPWLAKLLLVLDDNLSRNFTLPELAKLANVSQSTLQSTFNKTFGMSTGKYMTNIKMREAKRLIEMKKFSMKEIASKLSFSSPTCFTYAYKSFYGHPPSADMRK